ncbi:MAG: phosphate regulon transcriptional regulator PhoB [Candidatus Sedimenticola endophacoides]|uniref:Phosphate regulon transcriptional regulatory protein PhoB n=2 Tax=Candidatus Sedimenticola endophacoides TaxID=2548426 RepID=A0A657Q0S7_9GAMM|nr:MAG: phosphate regulon transcriptional regulatory protein PhoB [Candidatus Sedimenticola endophacoides]OQX32926.1 MAG: phosphate regulon transcriptional regulatory protein PhoB [Candidatus Sedimenticola endophacoides]OQX39519.1 MAG: phosphate regulon transcriptional regulatory protein PhoB [Candidatus Sedimenticola endophacoides]OQX41709.1 MAG: phosphate regulon transcriptional regulatory protein PhoB [Candidatus Sedimenticola endophacoides]OQX43961.1 MAG: phosphate regulon transcriptional r
MPAKILIVEDDPAVRDMIGFVLRQNDYETLEAADAEQARACLAESVPDMILMDWMLPGMSGVELIRQLKQDGLTRDIPVVLLTARGEEDDKVRGLECGAEDYVTKPFSPRELAARIKVILRRVAPHATEEKVTTGQLELDPASHIVNVGSQTVELGPTEFRLLHFFMTHQNKVYSRSRLLDRVWGANVFIEERTVDVHIRRLRKALEPHGVERFIQTVRGAGYRFSENYVE